MNTSLRDWEVEAGRKRRAAVSSFWYQRDKTRIWCWEEALPQERQHTCSVPDIWLCCRRARRSSAYHGAGTAAAESMCAGTADAGLDCGNISYIALAGPEAFAASACMHSTWTFRNWWKWAGESGCSQWQGCSCVQRCAELSSCWMGAEQSGSEALREPVVQHQGDADRHRLRAFWGNACQLWRIFMSKDTSSSSRGYLPRVDTRASVFPRIHLAGCAIGQAFPSNRMGRFDTETEERPMNPASRTAIHRRRSTEPRRLVAENRKRRKRDCFHA